MAYDLFEKNAQSNTVTIDIPEDINVFSDTTFSPESEYGTQKMSKIDQVFSKYEKKKENTIASNMTQVSSNPFFEERTFTKKENTREQIFKFRLKLAFFLYSFIFVALFGFMIYNFVAMNNISHSVDLKRVQIETIEKRLNNNTNNS